MIVTLAMDNDSTLSGVCGCRVVFNALEHYEIYLRQSVNDGHADHAGELDALHRVKTDYLDGLVSSLENAERSNPNTDEGGRGV